MGASTSGGDAPSSRDPCAEIDDTGCTGGTLILFDPPSRFRAVDLLDLALPWVLVCWTLAGVQLPDAEALLPLLFPARPTQVRARLRSLAVTAAMETRQAVQLADQLGRRGLVLLQLDRRPAEDLPDDFHDRTVPEQVELARACGVKLKITEEPGQIAATAFDDETYAGLRARHAAISTAVEQTR